MPNPHGRIVGAKGMKHHSANDNSAPKERTQLMVCENNL